MSALHIDAEALYLELRRGVHALLVESAMAAQVRGETVPADATPVLVGIWSGGAWLAERLQRDLSLPGPHGVISSALHRDDFSARGMASGSDATHLPFSVDGRPVILIDDVLYTGRTIRAVINELFDFGRPASVTLAVLVDRGGRELPIQPAFAAAKLALPAADRLSLARSEAGVFTFSLKSEA